jgi:predicted Rossmann fold nucleotide-binding protein DprA/Smf involved in DNA uptake
MESLTSAERAIVETMRISPIVDWSVLMSSTGLTLGELSMAVMDLELKGIIRTLPGKRYELV